MTSPMNAENEATGTPTSQNLASDQSIHCGNNNSDEIEDLQNGNGTKTLKRKRGPTRNRTLCRKKSAGEKVRVHVSKTSGRLIGDCAQEYMSETTCVIRKFGKWQAPKWAKLSQNDRDGMLKMINNNFIHDDGDHVEPPLLKQLNVQYRNRRYNFHKLFKTFKKKEEAISNCPTNMEKDDWIYLCNYFFSEEFKVISKRNATNRAKQKTAHTAGTKSYIRHKTEREAKEGRKIGPIELYDMTHYSKKKNAVVDELSESNSSKLKELLIKSQEVGPNRTEEEICTEVTGRIPGHVRGHGVLRTTMMAEQFAEIESLKVRSEQSKKRSEEAEKQSAELEQVVQTQQKLMEKLENQQRHSTNLLEALSMKFGLGIALNENATTN